MKLDLLFPVENQLELLKKGERFAEIIKAAEVEDGILQLQHSELPILEKRFEEFSGQVTKFVPASGAASRMFKHIYQLADESNTLAVEFIKNIERFPFNAELEKLVKNKLGTSVEELVQNKQLEELSAIILSDNGLNYGNSPKGLIPFHVKDNEVLSPFQIQLLEADQLNPNREVEVHFTIAQQSMEMVQEVVSEFIEKHDLKIAVSYSIQKPSTNTVALSTSGELALDEGGKVLTRPGGHGALIHNLNEMTADIIFMKNIDNVSTQKDIPNQIKWKKVLAVKLIEVQEELYGFQKSHQDGDLNTTEAINFLERTFGYEKVQPSDLEKLLFRPVRVCGMVKNEGQPGGGPYYVQDQATGKSLQIVESAEIDKNNPAHVAIMNKATHFNPVDIVCSIKDFQGNKYDLMKFVNEDACFTSQKDFMGQSITILELPGLWNGAMAHWNTIFMEVPAVTFNPVKTVNDLLKDSHQQ